MQGFFSRVGCAVAVLVGLAGLGSPRALAQGGELRKNIVVLVDSSKSVEETNRDSALKLVAGLIADHEGQTDPLWKDGWEFEEPPQGKYPVATTNLRRLFDQTGERAGLAADPAKTVICPIGNYERVAALRELLKNPESLSPEEIVGRLVTPPEPFTATDFSTHITLAKAAVAARFFAQSATEPYYLIIISDFNEDCSNSPLDAYDGGEKQRQLNLKNQKVLTGKEPFNDGGDNKGKYDDTDIRDIEGLDKIEDLLLGRFKYEKEIQGGGKLPVSVEIYTPVVACSLRAGSGTTEWVLPDPPPAVALELQGIAPQAPLRITVSHPGGGESRVPTDQKCDWLVTNKGKLDIGELADLLVGDGRKALAAPGRHQIKLSAERAIGLMMDAMVELEVKKPALLFADKALEQRSNEGQPYRFPEKWKAGENEIEIALDPKPTQDCKLSVQFGEGTPMLLPVPGNTGLARLKIPKDEIKTGGAAGERTLDLTATLPLPAGAAVRKVTLEFPELNIWAECPGAKVVDKTITLPEGGGLLTLCATYENIRGMQWAEPEVSGGTGPVVVENNKIKFPGKAPGEFTVKARFGPSNNPETVAFTVKVPKASASRLLIAMIGMVALGLALFAWHFFRR